MGMEYVKLSKEEKTYGYKGLLKSQLGLINLMKMFHNYKELRNMEFSLKVSLKSRIGQILGEIDRLEEILPKTHFLEEPHIRKENKVDKKENQAFVNEVNIIKEKLFNLQREM